LLVDLQKKLGNKGDLLEVVLDNYTLADGVYIILKKDGSYELINIIKDCPEIPDIEWLKKADYFSYLLDMNKAVDDKKQIHSSNPYSVFIKLDRLPVIKGAKNPGNLNEIKSLIEYYFSVFLKDKKVRYKDEGAKTLKAAGLPKLDTEEVNKCKILVLSKIESIFEEVGRLEKTAKNAYLKIFISTDIEKYRMEWMRYLVPKIFNKNDFNVAVDGKIYGLSNFNMGTNDKKPYLKLNTTKFEVPYRIDFDDSMTLKFIFDWLENYKNSSGKTVNTMYLGEKFKLHDDLNEFSDGNYLYFERGKTLEITDYDYIPQGHDPKEKFHLINITNLEKWDFNECVGRKELEGILSEIFFNRYLSKYYYTNPSDMKDKYSENDYSRKLQNLLIIYRKALFDFFRKNDDTSLRKCFEKMSMEIVIEYIRISKNTWFYKAAKALNLRISLLEHFKIGREECMSNILENYYEKVKTKMLEKDKTVVCDDEKEFFFTAGQVTSYLLSQSEAKDLKHSASDFVINAKDVKKVKDRLKELFMTYNHAISKNNTRFNNLFSMVMGYESNALTKEYLDYLLLGVVCNNMLYEKKEDKKS